MSRRKTITPSYQPSWLEQQQRSWEMEQRARQAEERARSWEVAADQMASSTYRAQQEVYQVQQQLAEAERRAQVERVALAEQQARALQELAGVRVELAATRSSVESARWESQALHQLTQQSVQALRGDVIEGFRQNRELHELAREQRERIQSAVDRNARMLEDNRQAIEANAERIQQAIQTVQDVERRRQIELLTSASRLLELARGHLEALPRQWMQRFDAHGFAESERLVEELAGNIARGLYEAALATGATALNRAAATAARVREAQAEYQRHWERAREAYDVAATRIRDLARRDEAQLWCGQRLQALQQELEALGRRWDAASLPEMSETQEGLDQVRALAEDLTARARATAGEVERCEALEARRLAAVHDYVVALEAVSRSVSQSPFYESDDPHGRVVITTDDGLQMLLPLEGDVEAVFPSHNTPAQYSEWEQAFSQQCERMGFAHVAVSRAPAEGAEGAGGAGPTRQSS